MKTHIAYGERTYCGRLAEKVRCIDLIRDTIDSATCKVCQASDDRRSVQTYRQEMIAAGKGDEL